MRHLRAFFLLMSAVSLGAEALAAEYVTAEQCSAAVLAADRPASEVSVEAIQAFLQSVGSTACWGSAEYSEWSNETLFNLMKRSPTRFFSILRRSSKAIQTQVLEELGQPIHDGFNYPAIHRAILGISDRELRKHALDTFTPFYRRHLAEIAHWERQNKAKWAYPEGQ